MKHILLSGVAALLLIFPALAEGQTSDHKKNTAPEKPPTKEPEKAGAPAPPTGLATVDGQTISEDDLAPYVAGQLRPLREQEYQIKKKALDALIGQKLLE